MTRTGSYSSQFAVRSSQFAAQTAALTQSGMTSALPPGNHALTQSSAAVAVAAAVTVVWSITH
jgi:hypothetical protein